MHFLQKPSSAVLLPRLHPLLFQMYSQGCGSALCKLPDNGQTALLPIASFLLLLSLLFEVQSFLLLPLLIYETIPSSFLSPEKVFLLLLQAFSFVRQATVLFHYRLPGLLPFQSLLFYSGTFPFFLPTLSPGSLFLRGMHRLL